MYSHDFGVEKARVIDDSGFQYERGPGVEI